ncbi:bifunctional adenosylcobinamide kinase/adenosylcobinamide-phosphate guanylyltransferase [Aciditerrimonas ferrireducens]|uniref:bifunctional adenosylcobinamide kinase/adenosylcobinamide-phosphate guanylyltransferase n=1 Tax=Aciditerrimonas ferrireducens TaxID=667306 RepID=UPI00200473BF|nr:bifunctional adenosylcobinamide kinase/adenosylcobinamide-phosphate guanylyltransferase [Aciditerrimonas ferrireducens]MCK4177394.1 bifunctional adenosylcobinamide kinase/adenosylcobinamide-phosphate guanylyltransferase [Aciditerrimonas ferrireducens]
MELERGTTLVLGGTRSGKSRVAEGLASAVAERSGVGVCYLATGPAPDGADPAWAARVAAHRARRPAGWTTREFGRGPGGPLDLRALRSALAETTDVCLLDSLGALVAELLVGAEDAEDHAAGPDEPGPDGPGPDGGVGEALAGLLEALRARGASGRASVVVSEEVGLAVHPPTALGRRFADQLGALNQAVAAMADQVLLVVAGRVLPLPPAPLVVAPGSAPLGAGPS